MTGRLRLGRWSDLTIGVIALLVGIVSIRVAQAAPGFSYLTDSALAGLVGLAAGLGLVAVGLETRRRGRRTGLGTLLAIAGIVWLLPDWGDPAIGSSVGFSLGVGLGWVYPAVVAQAVIMATDDGASRQQDRLLIVAGYALLISLGILPALVFDPQASGCTFCPANLLHVLGPTPGIDLVVTAVTAAAAVWAGFVAVALLVRVARAGPTTRRRRGLIALPGIVFFVVVGADLLRDAAIIVAPSDALDHRLRAAQAIALVALAIAIASEWLFARQARARAARLVADLAASLAIETLRGHLATVLGDPALQLVYPLASGTFVDAAGRTVTLDPQPGRTTTPVLRGGTVVAMIEHDAAVLREPGEVDEVVAAARLGLEHERLQAELRAQLDALRTARRRIVDAADAQRKRLERDLHDGAQQHLIALSIGVSLLDRDAVTETLLDAATAELHRALDELREIAHGIYPAILDDEGLAAAIEALAEGSSVPVIIRELDDVRCPRSVEIAAYQMVVAAVRSATGAVEVRVREVAGRLYVEVALPAIEDDVVQDIADRVGAVDGTITIVRKAELTSLVGDLPCAS
ncbi:MAG TPA: histidine kinase dimerization/phosphoacceptor domain-containing protein [Candidatus Limnocylindrales bacterium]